MNIKTITTVNGKKIQIDRDRYNRYLDQGNFENIKDLQTGLNCLKSKRKGKSIFLVTAIDGTKHFISSKNLPKPVGIQFRSSR